jgi:hypothetical protein
MSDPTTTPTPTETLRERVRGALATVPLGEDDVHVFYVAEKHLDRLTDAVLAAVSAAAPARPTTDDREALVGRGGLTGTEFVITAWHIEDGRVVADEKVTADEYAAQHRPAPAVSAPYPRVEAEVLRATANDLGDWLGSSDLMADEISDHGIDVILRWLRERADQVEHEGGEE